MITAIEAIEYEVQSSWWAGWFGCPMPTWALELTGRYYAQKVRRKMARVLGRQALIHQLQKEGRLPLREGEGS